MFKYLGKVFVTVEDAMKAELKEKGKTVSYKAMQKTLEELHKKQLLAKRKRDEQVGYTPVENEWEAVHYDEGRSAVLEIIERMNKDLDIGFHTGCF
jgi:predicted transcriptional regulator